MTKRLEESGLTCSPYNPRLDEYTKASEGGWLLTFVLRHEGNVCGYSNVYLTNDMHNQDLIAQEDTVFVLKEHRNGIGRKLIHFVHDELKKLGVKRLNITTGTDLRVSKLLCRIGYKHTAHAMTITF
jgi:GNAT superfamily N-acetyltransferase